MSQPLRLDPERFFPADAGVRSIAVRLFSAVERLPIVSPHGHTDPAWFATNASFEDAVSLLLWPDHYLLRMLMSAGLSLESLGVRPNDDSAVEADRRVIWRRFAEHYRLFRATPSRLWLDHVFADIFELDVRLDRNTADFYFDTIKAALSTAKFKPRALYDRFGIEVLATTEGALDSLQHHRAIAASGWKGRIITTFRPDDVIDPERVDFGANVRLLGELTGEDTRHWEGYLAALKKRRAFFREHGATATDHGHPTALTANLPLDSARDLFTRMLAGVPHAVDAELFRGQMLTEMAGMSCEDG
ncbi:MAG TPA: glucuronate isomerase, partial [Steroidobacteraceae bacterium]